MEMDQYEIKLQQSINNGDLAATKKYINLIYAYMLRNDEYREQLNFIYGYIPDEDATKLITSYLIEFLHNYVNDNTLVQLYNNKHYDLLLYFINLGYISWKLEDDIVTKVMNREDLIILKNLVENENNNYYGVQLNLDDTLRSVINNGHDVDNHDNDDLRLEIVKYLIENKGINFTSKSDWTEETPLADSIITQRFNIAKYLISKGAGVKTIKKILKKEHFVNHNNLDANDLEIINVILDLNNGENKELINKCIINTGNINLIQKCLNYGGNINTQDKKGNTLLIYACIHYEEVDDDMYKLICFLLSHGADVNIQNDDGETPLLKLGRYDYQILNELIKYGADVNIQDNEGDTALMNIMKSKSRNNFEIISFLFNNGANLNLVNNEGKTVLNYAYEVYEQDKKSVIKEEELKNRLERKYKFYDEKNYQLILYEIGKDISNTMQFIEYLTDKIIDDQYIIDFLMVNGAETFFRPKRKHSPISSSPRKRR